jgi:hypothetical protein
VGDFRPENIRDWRRYPHVELHPAKEVPAAVLASMAPWICSMINMIDILRTCDVVGIPTHAPGFSLVAHVRKEVAAGLQR